MLPLHDVSQRHLKSAADPGGGGGRKKQYTLKIPLNWLKFTKKTLGASPQIPVRSLFSDPGSATESTVCPMVEDGLK